MLQAGLPSSFSALLCFFLLFIYFLKYLFIWLHQVSVVAQGIFVALFKILQCIAQTL